MDNNTLDELREPWFSALNELKQEWPQADVRIVIYPGRVRIYRNKTLMTNRPTLEEAMGIFYKVGRKKQAAWLP